MFWHCLVCTYFHSVCITPVHRKGGGEMREQLMAWHRTLCNWICTTNNTYIVVLTFDKEETC